jgi:hypothetical protein
MLQQAILPFKMERTDEMITPRSGLVLFAELVRAFKVKLKDRKFLFSRGMESPAAGSESTLPLMK